LWFTTLGGVAVVNPEAAPFNPLPPPVRIEGVKIDNAVTAFSNGNDGNDEIRLLPGQANLEIRYTGLSFVKPDQVQFRYQLAGQDQDWIEAGARRTANYSYLQPGAYNFRVLAANSDGVWDEAGASLRVVVLPPFYRTLWFRGLVALAIAGLIALVFRLRVAQLRKEHATREAFSRQLLESQEAFSRRLIESQEAERKRIAAELHDGLGQSLAIIKNRALHSLADPDDHDRALEQIEEIAEASGHAIQEAREIAYNLRPFHIDRLGLTAALAAMIKRASSDELQITTELDSIDGLLAPEQEINLYRIAQEGVNNIVKHAAASAANVTIKRREGMIELTIADNGRGFEVAGCGSRIAESGNGSGFGLLGLTERARILSCVPVITSAPGEGTMIQLKLAAGPREQRDAD
jgi:signal transduction histidine kinase